MANCMLVFDIDGTLFDTKPGIFSALEDVFTRFDLGTFDRAHGMRYIGPPVKQSLMTFNGLSEETSEKATAYYREVYVNKYIALSSPYDGVFQMLANLKDAGHLLSIATMKTRKQVDKLLDITGTDRNLFEFIETALENGKMSKEKMLENISSNSDYPVVMIGDTEGDKKAACMSKNGFVGVTYGYGFDRNSCFDFPVANSVTDLFDLIEDYCSKY